MRAKTFTPKFDFFEIIYNFFKLSFNIYFLNTNISIAPIWISMKLSLVVDNIQMEETVSQIVI